MSLVLVGQRSLLSSGLNSECHFKPFILSSQILVILAACAASVKAEAYASADANPVAEPFFGGSRCDCRNYYVKRCEQAEQQVRNAYQLFVISRAK